MFDHKKKYLAYLRSKQWSEIKADLLIIRGSKCERCHKKYKRGSALHLHHLTYKNLFNEEPEDLELLCSKCHRKEHHKKPKEKPVKVKAKKTKKSKKVPTWYPDRKK